MDDTFFFLAASISGGGGDPVEGVVALDNASVRLSLAGFYHLVLVVRNEKLKAVLQERRGWRFSSGMIPLGSLS
ncbi:hypothetical protein EYF80_024949 [Liparis tanakae]|uniref:Uncharacterized protein n=1 Tax=Liparis tanakae TaxID=230148 RepID=A0A4Z2HG54_9TELE|nr:hypothetical protein EYF80_024949 [Liparis tanakae]